MALHLILKITRIFKEVIVYLNRHSLIVTKSLQQIIHATVSAFIKSLYDK